MRSIVTEGAAGAQRQRISLAHLLQPCGVGLGALLHGVARGGERIDAGEEVWQVLGVGEMWRRAPVRGAGALLRDLAAAHGDPETQAVFRVEDHEFEMAAEGRVDQELGKLGFVLRDVDQLRHAMAQGLGALANMIAGEEVAQEDPEPFHPLTVTRPGARPNLRGSILQILARRHWEGALLFFCVLRIWEGCFLHFGCFQVLRLALPLHTALA